MTSGDTAVHSDMVMWNYEESAECAAFQLTRVLFAVPQISVRSSMMNEKHSQMVKHYLALIDMVDSEGMGNYECAVYDCCGEEVYREELRLQELTKISKVPINGTVYLTEK